LRDAGLFVQKCRYLLLKCSYCPEVMNDNLCALHCPNSQWVHCRTVCGLSNNISYSTALLTHLRRQCEDSSNSQYRVRISSLIVADHRPKHVANNTVAHEVRLILYRAGVHCVIIGDIYRLLRAVATNKRGWSYFLVSASIC